MRKLQSALGVEAALRDDFSPALNEAVTSKEAFVGEATGAEREHREGIYERFDQDGVEGLSQTETAAAQAALGTPPDPASLSDEVRRKIDHALKDDTDTLEDLVEAGENIQSAADAQAILDAAVEKGLSDEDQHTVLQALTRGLDERAQRLTPEMRAMYGAVAAGFDRLGRGDLGSVLRGAADATKDVRTKLVHAIQDGTDTAEDLGRAAKAARTPADLELVMGLQRALGVGEPFEILREALKGLDENNTDLVMMNAIAAAFEGVSVPEYVTIEGVDAPDYAVLVAAAARPEVNSETRKRLIHALQDDRNTARDIGKAFEETETTIAVETVQAAGDARLGADHTGLLAIANLQSRYENALEAAEELAPTLQLGLAALEGATDEQKEKFKIAFQEQHKDVYGEVEAAKASLVDALEAAPEDLTAFITGERSLPGVDPLALVSSLALVADTPDGARLANQVADALAEQLNEIGEGAPSADSTETLRQQAEIYRVMMDDVLPVLMSTNPGVFTADAAEQWLTSPENSAAGRFTQALGNLSLGSNVVGAWAQSLRTRSAEAKSNIDYIEKLNKALKNKDQTRAHEILNDLATAGKASSTAIAAVGIAAGVVAFVDSEASWNEKVEALLTLGKEGTDLANNLFSVQRTLNGLEETVGDFSDTPLGKNLTKASGVIGVALNAWGAYQAFRDGDVAAGIVGSATTVLSAIGLALSVPGINAATTALAIGFALYQNAQQQNELNRRRDDVARALVATGNYEPRYAEFMAYSKPGTPQRVQETLGVTQAELSEFLEGNPDWVGALDDVAHPEFINGLAEQLRQPDESILDLLARIHHQLPEESHSAGYNREEALRVIAEGLVVISVDSLDQYGKPRSNQDKLNGFITSGATADSSHGTAYAALQALILAIGPQ